MSLRPRYSLLTLLVLTALVAGGVKLWYGPHHVVEPDSIFPNSETEYSYTLDWRGNRIIHGPVVLREYKAGTLVHLLMSFYRQGNNSGWFYSCGVRNLTDYPKKGFGRGGKCPLTEHELREFYQVRDTELQRIVAMGKAIDNQEESDLGTILTRPVQKSAYPGIKP